YYTLGEGGPATKRLWLATHGYGQAAERFIKKFSGVAGEKDLVVAPEGLSRFYWGGLDGEVVASWMTRGGRLAEIADYCAYLSQLLALIRAGLPDDVQLILFGFSQGCATQMRWIQADEIACDALILWAGTLPEDIDYANVRDRLNEAVLIQLRGDKDPLIVEKYIDRNRDTVARAGLNVEERVYAGVHRIERRVLEKLAEEVHERIARD
ncbi:MAG: hypothetical protein WBA17_05035, partial [Saprospiraceae bacterium]